MLGAFALTGAVWVIILFLGALQSVEEPIPPLSFTLVLAMACLCGTPIAYGIAYWRLLRGEAVIQNRQPALLAFYMAQLLRYLPGRIWGMVYQLANSRPATRSAIVRANFDFILIATLVNTAVCSAVAGASLGWSAIVTWGIPLASMTALALRFSPYTAGAIHAIVLHFAPRIADRIGLRTLEPRSPTTVVTTAAILCAALASYSLAWVGLGHAHDTFADLPMLRLGALYALSSILGMLAFVTPGGLGVREGSFLSLGFGLASPELLALLAVLFRVATFGSEVLVSGVAIVALRNRRPYSCKPTDRADPI